MAALLVLSTLVAGAMGHGGMVSPAPRNAAGVDPRARENACGSKTPYSQGGFYPGEYCGVGCTGDACLWYAIGCYAGCANCSYQGKDLYPTAQDLRLAGDCAPAAPTVNARALRTYNIDSAAGSAADWTRVMPWRAPGTAGAGNPAFDPCGVNSGDKTGATPTATGFDEVGMPGTRLPAPAGASPAAWRAGGVVEVEWAIYANHAGGYSYRLCKKRAESGFAGVTEACFQATPLAFADNRTTVRYYDGSRPDFDIAATTTAEGTFPAGSQWRKNPIPMCNCDQGAYCKDSVKADKEYRPYAATYLHDGQDTSAWGCPTGLMFESAWDEGYGDGSHGNVDYGYFPWTLVDRVKIPDALEPGEYVVSWRWDCEQTPQVWNSCADVTVER